jgi:glutamine amidotransferase
MQILARSSEEGVLPGLGWIDGEVKKFKATTSCEKLNIPHMGWNNIIAVKPSKLLYTLEAEPYFYFLHSYYFSCALESDVLALTEYGMKFVSVVNHKNIYGIQCHPEKSHQNGIQLLKNFANI